MIFKVLIHITSAILFLNSGANDSNTSPQPNSFFTFVLVLTACATVIGSRCLERRYIIFFTLLSIILTYYILKLDRPVGKQADLWYTLIRQTLFFSSSDNGQNVLSVAVIFASIFTLISIISKFPLPLDTYFCSFFGYNYFAVAQQPVKLARTLTISYLVLPAISGCCTWLIYRILIRGILYADAEEMFKMTLSWCGLIYPAAVSATITAFALTYLFYSFQLTYKIASGLLVLFVSFALSYASFKIFFRAWIKRQAFLSYPQEYAVYLERSEKMEQGDREARGLGPIQNYYLPKVSSSSSNPSPIIRQSQSINLDSNSMIPQPSIAISPAVIAGKMAIISKRSEELFRPITNFMSISLLFTFSSFESFNVMTIVNAALDSTVTDPFILWPSIIAILIGSVFFSQRYGQYLGRSIIHDMKFSQAFAIQLGVLFTLTLVLFLHSIPPAPMWYLLASISAVSSSTTASSPVKADKDILNDSDPEVEERSSFRYKLGLIGIFWTFSIIFGFTVGSSVSLTYNKKDEM